jgi:phosphoglycerate dehydrogenase-like enzyme
VTRVLLHYRAGPRWIADLASLASEGLDVDVCDERDDDRFYRLLPETEVLWHVLRPLSADDLARAERLRLIQKLGVGVNTIDLPAAEARGIAVCNMPGTNAPAVAEMTLLLMLACLRRLPVLDRETRATRGWSLDTGLLDSFGELGGRTIGLVGFGGIPRLLTPVLEALGARVGYTATARKAEVPLPYWSLDELLQRSDVVSLHVPLTPATDRMIGADEFARMRPGSVLVNTARGALVDERALERALRDGPLAAAGLDVFATEPLEGSEALLALDNVVVTPHLAWLTNATLDRSLGVAVENVRRLERRAQLLHRVV